MHFQMKALMRNSSLKRTHSVEAPPVITLDSPSPEEASGQVEASTSQSSSLPKRVRLEPEWIPPIPDAVKGERNPNSKSRLDCSMQFTIQQLACNCPRAPPGMPIICRCILNGPVPHVRIPGVNRTFEVFGRKWMFAVLDIPPTPVMSNIPNKLAQVLIYPIEGEMLSNQSMTVKGSMSFISIRYDINNAAEEVNEFTCNFGIEITGFHNRDQYTIGLDRQQLNQLCPQPMGNPSFPYPSSINFAIEVNLQVDKNENFDIPFTLDFSQRNSLSNLIIACGPKLLYANHMYLAHHSHFFWAISKHSDSDNRVSVKTHITGLPMVSMEENDYDLWIEILSFCSPCRSSIRNAFLLRAVQLADLYQFYMLKVECENRMMSLVGTAPGRNSRREQSDLEFLAIADHYQLSRLKELTLTTICRSQNVFFHVIQNDEYYEKLTMEQKTLLIDRAAQKSRVNIIPHSTVNN